MSLSPEHRRTLWHMLGVDTRKIHVPGGWRNHYAAGTGREDHLDEMAAAGLVEAYWTERPTGYLYFRATEAGKAASEAARLAEVERLGLREFSIQLPGFDGSSTTWAPTRSKARYEAFLNLRDVDPDLKIHQIKVTAVRPEVKP